MITIRDANEEDLPAVIDSYNQSILRPATQTRSPFRRRSGGVVQKFDARRPMWVAEDAGRIVGCAYLSGSTMPVPPTTGPWRSGPASQWTTNEGTRVASQEKMIEACPRLGSRSSSAVLQVSTATDKVIKRLGFEVVGHLPGSQMCLGRNGVKDRVTSNTRGMHSRRPAFCLVSLMTPHSVDIFGYSAIGFRQTVAARWRGCSVAAGRSDLRRKEEP